MNSGSLALLDTGALQRYALALLAVAGAVALENLLAPLPVSFTVPIFVGAVMISAWAGGVGPGLVATGLSLAALAFVVPTRHADPAWLVSFLGLSLLICLIAAINWRTQQRLRQSEARTRAIVQTAVDGIITIDARGIIETFNPAAERIFGYPAREVVGKNVSVLMPSPDRERHDGYVGHYLRTGQRKIIGIGREVTGLRKDGRTFPLHLAVSEMRLGQRRMFAGIIHDLTERKAAEESVIRQQRLIEAVFDNILAHVAYLDLDFRIVRVNATYARGAGCAPEGLEGRSHFEIFPQEHGRSIFQRVRDTGTTHVARAQPMVLPHRPERGTTYWDWWLRPIRDAEGKTEGLVISLVDVTATEQSRHEVQRLNEELKAANSAKDEFLAVLSHELRTPLTPVLVLAASMEQQPGLSPDVQESLGIIRRNAELEARLIDDLLDLTRIARGKLQLQFHDVDVHALLTSALQICQADIAARGQHVAMHLPAQKHFIHGDPARLQQVFWNLIKNSVKFTPDGGCIGIRTMDQEDGWMAVEVIDSGIGIEPEVLPRIFNAFEQGKPTITSRFGGLGLGLAITRALVERHGGHISAHSAGRGTGATFTVSLKANAQPSAARLAETPSSTADAEAKTAPGKAPGRQLRILLVEDHEDTARVMSRLLRQAGHEVVTARSVGAAIEAVSSGGSPFDLMISDLGLPDGNGLDLMRELRKRQPLRGIALSGFGMDADIRKSREAGFEEHLTKPVEFSRLQAVIQELIG